MVKFINLPEYEENRRRMAISPYVKHQRNERRALWWFCHIRLRLRAGSKHGQLWLSRYGALFGMGEYYRLLQDLINEAA